MKLRALVLATFLSLAACANPYEEAKKADTIEAYEKFLQEHPDDGKANIARQRLAELKLAEVKKTGTLEAYDAFIKEFPKGKAYQEAMKERKTLLVDQATTTDTAEAWQKVIDDYGKTDRKLLLKARRKIASIEARAMVDLGAITPTQVNLAGDPKGAMDGWKFTAPITNKGTKPAAEMVISISFTDENGKELTAREWPVVAKRLPEALPMPAGFDTPMQPGETRTWTFQAGDLPAGWKNTKLDIARVKWVEPGAAAEAGADKDAEGDAKDEAGEKNEKNEKKAAPKAGGAKKAAGGE